MSLAPDALQPAAEVEPFWQRVHRFFALPFDRAVLARIGGLAAWGVLALALFFLGALGVIVGLVALLAMLVVGARYGFKIIERSSRGYLQPSAYPLSDEDLVSPYLPYKFVAMNFVFGAALVLVSLLTGGSEFFTLLAWFALFVVIVPAATMRLVVTGSLRAALNPVEVVALIGRFGKPYAALAAFVFCADLCRTYGIAAVGVAGGIGAGALGMAGGPKAALGVGGIALIFFMVAAFWYFTYVICALIGYAMYQYADTLDIAVVGPGEARTGRAGGRGTAGRTNTRDALIGQMVAAGEIAEATALLAEDLHDRPNDLALHGRYHRLLVATGDAGRIESHADKYLTLLVRSENWREAIELYEDTSARRPDWSIREVGNIVPLAQSALRDGKPKIASALLRAFDRKYPDHPDVPRAYLLGAQLMAEYAGKAEEAKRILRYLVKRHGGTPAAAEAEHYLEVMQRSAV
jgi:hypothetical protein